MNGHDIDRIISDINNNSNNANPNSNNDNPNNHNIDREWYKNKSLRLKCECEMCRLGLATTHNDSSHDQSLLGSFTLATDNRFELSLIGGSTKCGRIMSNYFGYLINKKQSTLFNNSTILEVGSGTGIVGLTLAYLCNQNKPTYESNVIMTDQPGVIDILDENINEMCKDIEAKCNFEFNSNIKTGELYWGKEDASKYLDQNVNILIGSDLIYAKEGIRPLVETFEILSDNEVSVDENGGKKVGSVENGYKHPIVYMAIIRRFKWEEMFFELMKNKFVEENVLTDGDIALYRYVRKEDSKNENEK